MIEEPTEVYNTPCKKQKVDLDDASDRSTRDEVEERSGTCKFHKVGDVDHDETWYDTPTDGLLQSWLQDYKRVEKDDDGKPNPQSFNKVQPVEGKTNANAVKADDSRVPDHLWNDWVVEKLQEE